MRTKINGFEVEGTPEEIRTLLQLGVTTTEKTRPKNDVLEYDRMSRKSINKVRWTRKEKQTLKYMADNGNTVREIGEVLGRTVGSVGGAASRYNIKLKPSIEEKPTGRVIHGMIRDKPYVPTKTHIFPRNFWTKDEEDELINMRNKGKTFVKIGKILRRTSSACRQRYKILKKSKQTFDSNIRSNTKPDFTSWATQVRNKIMEDE